MKCHTPSQHGQRYPEMDCSNVVSILNLRHYNLFRANQQTQPIALRNSRAHSIMVCNNFKRLAASTGIFDGLLGSTNPSALRITVHVSRTKELSCDALSYIHNKFLLSAFRHRSVS